jgi:glycosyltransferase involved in cell wall biosynthesis
VLHVIETLGPGGGEEICIRVAAGIREKGWESLVAVPGEGWITERCRVEGLPFILAPSGRVPGSIGYVARLARHISRRIALVQAHFLDTAVSAGLAASARRVPVVATIHGVVDLQPHRRFQRARRLLFRSVVDRAACVSESVRTELVRRGFMSAERAVVIPNGAPIPASRVSREEMRRRLGVVSTECLVGTLGNIRGPKGHDTFVEMAGLLAQRRQGYRFAVVGDTTSPLFPDLQRRCAELGLARRVEFVGYQEQFADWLQAFDVLVVPSHSEGFSLSTVYGMALGVPVVATRSGGPEEIIEDGTSGLLVPVRDPEALAAAVERVGADGQLRRCLVAGGKARAERYSTGAMIAAYTTLYAQLAA